MSKEEQSLLSPTGTGVPSLLRFIGIAHVSINCTAECDLKVTKFSIRTTSHFNHIGVGREAWVRDDDLVARLNKRHRCKEEARLAPRPHHDHICKARARCTAAGGEVDG